MIAENFDCLVKSAKINAPNVVRYELEPLDWGAFAHWEAGSHVDIYGTCNFVRNYSLLPTSSGHIAFAVKMSGRPSQVAIQEALIPGRLVSVGRPRKLLSLEPAKDYLFIAGGIGITPIYSLVYDLTHHEPRKPWRLHYIVQSISDAVFIPEIIECADRSAGEVFIHTTASSGRPDISSLTSATRRDTLVYACGPDGLLENVVSCLEDMGASGRLRVERFFQETTQAEVAGRTQDNTQTKVLIDGTNQVVEAPKDRPLLFALREAGVKIPTSCERGICGSCGVDIVSGVVEHKDAILSKEERRSQTECFPCVSLPLSDELNIRI